MHKVFAVFIFVLLFLGCMKASMYPEIVLPVYSTFMNNSIYSAPGDFDGDGDLESIFITKPDESCYISILDKDSIKYKKLDYPLDDFKLTIEDVNNDTKEEIILNTIQNNCENCYVYAINNDIITILSPEIIKSNIDIQKIENYIALECGNFYSPAKGNGEPYLKLFFTEVDYEGDTAVFVSEGAIYKKSTSIVTIHTTISVDTNGNIIVKKINMLPVKK